MIYFENKHTNKIAEQLSFDVILVAYIFKAHFYLKATIKFNYHVYLNIKDNLPPPIIHRFHRHSGRKGP